MLYVRISETAITLFTPAKPLKYKFLDGTLKSHRSTAWLSAHSYYSNPSISSPLYFIPLTSASRGIYPTFKRKGQNAPWLLLIVPVIFISQGKKSILHGLRKSVRPWNQTKLLLGVGLANLMIKIHEAYSNELMKLNFNRYIDIFALEVEILFKE